MIYTITDSMQNSIFLHLSQSALQAVLVQIGQASKPGGVILQDAYSGALHKKDLSVPFSILLTSKNIGFSPLRI